MYNYKDIADELISSDTIPPSHIYDYSTNSIVEIFERYFQYCQIALSEYSEEFNIQPAKIFFHNVESVNAAAACENSYYVIRINKGLIETLYDILYVKNNMFELSPIRHIYAQLASSFDVPLEYIMFQLATYFTFYHERAHLFQKSPIILNYLDEINFEPSTENYSSLHHSLEFDADIDAAQRLVMVISGFWEKVPEQFHTEEYANEILSLTIASVFTYFMFLEEKYSEIYYKMGTHPHPIIRITYILDVMVNVAPLYFENINLDHKRILRQGLKIATEFCALAEFDDMTERYIQMLFNEYGNIEDFINNVLIPESDQIPYLIKNKRQTTS